MELLLLTLGNELFDRPFEIYPSEMRVKVNFTGLYTYPDISVICGPPKLADGRTDTVLNPVLIIEVLSPSTELLDRGFRTEQYKTIATLQEYALVSQSEARVEVYRRQDGEHWLLSEFAGMEASARFNSVEASVPLAEIYDKVRFDEEEA